jgi:hypothetical protein
VVLAVLFFVLTETAFFFDALLRESESVDPCPLIAAQACEVDEFSESDELDSVPEEEEELEEEHELLLDEVDSELVTLACWNTIPSIHNNSKVSFNCLRDNCTEFHYNSNLINFSPNFIKTAVSLHIIKLNLKSYNLLLESLLWGYASCCACYQGLYSRCFYLYFYCNMFRPI